MGALREYERLCSSLATMRRWVGPETQPRPHAWEAERGRRGDVV